MADEKLNVQFGADTGELQSGTEAAATAVESSANRITSGFEHMKSQCVTAVGSLKTQIESGFSQINKVMGAISGAMDGVKNVLEGGKAFKEMVDASKAWTGEAIRLSKQLNVTTESASALMVASRSLGLTNEQVEGTVKGFVQQVRENEVGLNKMGIATKDGSGHTRNMMDIMIDANTVLLSYKEGKDRDAAATAVYGQEILQNSQFLQMNKAAMEEAKRRQEELGIEVGPKAVAQYKEYNRAINDVNLILDAMKIQIGNAVMPVLTAFGSWISGNGPQLMEIFKGALNGVVSACEYVGLGLIVLYETVKTVFERIAIKITTAGQIIGKVMHGDFSGAVDAYKSGVQQMSDATDRWMDKLATAVDKTNSSLSKMWGLTQTKKSSLPPDGGGGKEYHGGGKGEKGGKGGGNAEKSRMAEWKAGLESWKDDQGNYFRDYTKVELKYWQDALKLTREGSNEQRQVRHEISQLKSKVAHEDLAVQLQALKEESDNALKGSQQRIEIAKRKAALIKDTHREESKDYRAVLEEIRKLEKEHDADVAKRELMKSEKKRELASIEISAERDKISALKSMGEISAQEEIERLKKLEERMFAIQRAVLEEKIALQRQGSEEETKAINNLQGAEAKHLKSMQKLNLQAATEQKKEWTTVFSSIGNSFSNSIKGMVSGTMTFRKAMQQLVKGVLDSFISMGLKMVTDWIQKEVLMTSITKMYTAVRTALFGDAATTTTAVATAASNSQIASTAPAAAAGAASSQASIPYAGPILAAAAMAAMLSMVLGLKSAAGGYEIPAGVNPMTQLHSDEMVLPADLSSGLKNIIRGDTDGVGGPGGSGGTHVHMHVNTLDAKGVKSFMKANKAAVASAAIAHARNMGSLTPARGTR